MYENLLNKGFVEQKKVKTTKNSKKRFFACFKGNLKDII